ncbi:3'(2'),5'-bisphosphate nucleotidase [Prosthecochloris sp. GSB1]|nr:3'(2'),5'-bisphosphate nucleotidase CysQ [Prosthecochloris sp. GSB1]ASQ89823.1 3'(2'),5'-bisphosphate nucleotidase [Prosthecochloris sp. GSB1]
MDREQLMNTAVGAAVEAGSAVLDICREGDFGIERKDDDSPLTKADRMAHELIRKVLEPSGLPLLSEEGQEIPFAVRRRWKRFWMVDPLDGTKEFISGNGEFTVNIALVDNQAPALGVVFVPVTGELFFGDVCHGAWYAKHHGRGLAGTVSLPFDGKARAYRVVASRSHMTQETAAFIERLRAEYPSLEIVRRGSSLKICMVAAGEADIYPRFGPTMEWDTAAGDAIMRSVGKKLVDPSTGFELRYNKEHLLNPFFIAT